MGVHGHGHVGDHLIVNKLVGLGEDHVAVQRHKAAKRRGLEDIDALVLADGAEELLIQADIELHIVGLYVRKPDFRMIFHLLHSFQYL